LIHKLTTKISSVADKIESPIELLQSKNHHFKYKKLTHSKTTIEIEGSIEKTKVDSKLKTNKKLASSEKK
jgi:hypothetical protein